MSKSKSDSKKSTNLKIRQRRIFSESFKREKVQELTAGLYTVRSFSKLWEVAPHTVYRWIYKYSPQHKQAGAPVRHNYGCTTRK